MIPNKSVRENTRERMAECSCLEGKEIDFDTQGAFCPVCQGFVHPLGEGLIEEKIWQSELIKSHINQLSQHAGEGFNLSMNRLKESINQLAGVVFTQFQSQLQQLTLGESEIALFIEAKILDYQESGKQLGATKGLSEFLSKQLSHKIPNNGWSKEKIQKIETAMKNVWKNHKLNDVVDILIVLDFCKQALLSGGEK